MNWQSSVVDPVLHVVVVGFHHKKGCQVEYAYPPLIAGNDVASNECPTKWKHLPSLALPDGAHNYTEDTIYFHLPSLDANHTTIFGVSCCQQIDASEVLNRSEDVTRNTVQKSVCVLSRLPVFGLIRVKLEMITQAYFKGRDFSQVELLEDTYKTLNASLTECLLQNSHIHLGLSGRDLLRQFRHKLVVLFKLFLLEKKILFFSSPVKPICTSILAVASLFPGLIEQGLFESTKFEETRMPPSMELGTSFHKIKSSSSELSAINSKDSNCGHLSKSSNNIASSLQQIPQQKWHSTTLSQLRNKLISSFKGNNNSLNQSFFTSLPSIPVSAGSEQQSDGNKSFHGNSIFYGKDLNSLAEAIDSLPDDHVISRSNPNNSNDSYNHDVHHDVANSTFFIGSQSTPTTTTIKNENLKSLINPSDNSNQALVHFSRQTSLPDKPRSQSIIIDKPRSQSIIIDKHQENKFEGHSNRSLPVNMKSDEFATKLSMFQTVSVDETSTQKHDSTISNQNRTFEELKSCDTNLEEMLVDDDDDVIIFKEGQHRLEINEFPLDPVMAHGLQDEIDSSEVEKVDETTKASDHRPINFNPQSSFDVGTDNFGLPLMIFSKGVFCHPYLSLHFYDVLTNPDVKGFVIGATNALFKQRRQLLDAIIELNESRIDVMDGELKKCLILSTADLRFAETLVRGLVEESGDPFLDNTGWEGGDDWIRSQFKSYLMSLLATVHHGDEKTEEDFNSSFVESWKVTNNYKMWMQNGPYEALSSIPAQHVCKGNLSMSDVKLKINQVINNGGKERKIASVVNQTVAQTGKAVGAAVNLAKSTVSNWFGGFSSKE